MLDLSMGEIGVIAAIALVVLGPDKLPQVAKTAGSLMGKAQRFVSQVKNDIDKEVELSELKKIQEDAKKMASDLQSSLKNTTDSIEKQVSDVRDSVTSAGQEVKSTMDNASKELKDQWMESTAPKAELSMENIVDGTAKTEALLPLPALARMPPGKISTSRSTPLCWKKLSIGVLPTSSRLCLRN